MGDYEDDEQQAQKRNGRSEAQVRALENQVLQLQKQNTTLQEKLNVALVTGTSGASEGLKKEFISICTTNSSVLDLPEDVVLSVDEFTDQMGILALSKISTTLQKNTSAGVPRVPTREGVGRSRSGTATSRSHEPTVEELNQRIHSLEEELHTALLSAEDIRLLKGKLMSLVERARIDKERLIKAESDSAFSRKRMEMLRDHLEKLMTHLKHEAASKVRAQEQLRVKERELYKVEENARIIQRKSSAKDRLVLELREGSKILEDQLRLMDEKYLELRVKLDWARENGEKKVKQAQAKAKELRIKFTMLGGGSLDKIQLPSLSSNQGGGSSYVGMDSMAEGSNVDFYEGQGQESYYSAPGTGKSNKSAKSGGGSLKKGPNSFSGGKSMDSLGVHSVKQPTLDGVMEKIRKHAGGKTEWTDDQLRELAKSR